MRFLILFALVAVCNASHFRKKSELDTGSPLFKGVHLDVRKGKWHPSTEEQRWIPKTQQEWYEKIQQKYPESQQEWHPKTEEKFYPKWQQEQRWWLPKTQQEMYPGIKQWYPQSQQELYPKTQEQLNNYVQYKDEMPFEYIGKQMPYQYWEKEDPLRYYDKETIPFYYEEQMPHLVYQYYKQGVTPVIQKIQDQLEEHQEVALKTLIDELGYHNVEVLFNYLVGHTFTLMPKQYMDLVRVIEERGFQHVQKYLNVFAGETFFWRHENGMKSIVKFKHFIDLEEVLEDLKHCCTEFYRWEQPYSRYQNKGLYDHETKEGKWPKYMWSQESQTGTWNREWPLKLWNRENTPIMGQREYPLWWMK